LLVQNTLCPHCFGLYNLNDLKGISRVLTLLLTSFPKLAMLFYLCRCPFFLCFSLVLFLLLLRVGFELNLSPFWGYLNFVSHAFIGFIGSIKPFKMKTCKFFAFLLIELFETRQTN
jgi:hypothetical protein